MIEADLHQIYGIDLGDRALLRARTWRWLKARILGLLDVHESRLSRALIPEPVEPKGEELWRSS